MGKEMCAPVLLLNVSYTLHTDKGYGWVRNVSTSLNQWPNLQSHTELVKPVTFIFIP